ncbi:DAHL domain-containing protein [Azoarcus sp. KH32C]|uniref:DAHL domain-containing protein n=1 Tax=Azoarcus sp. KH32C TaxID=748247 RepID=UPI00023869BD|nr:DAHL domain-containing protein [Azoarcus sp. KH32C]BAL26469.1 putative two-component sensor histidine kinase [Azoarcus sp. KH32C]
MTHPKRRIYFAIAAMVAVLTSALAFLYAKTRAYDETRHFENLANLREIEHLDAHWELDALKSRLGINTHYDPLAAALPEFRRMEAELRALVADGLADTPSALVQNIDALDRSIQQKTELIEHFKSHNAVLRNSMAFLPTAADDVQELVDAALAKTATRRSGGMRRIPEDTDDLLLAAFVYGHDGSEDRAGEVEDALSRIAADTDQLPADIRERLDVFAAHIRTVLREHRVLIGLLDEIAAVSIDRHIDDIEALLSDQYLRASTERHRYGRYLLGFAALLTALLVPAAYSAIRNHGVVKRVNRELQEANESLEQRVRERTRELHETQAELVDAARHAGMAEIATNVLHNVGNVLNSVNVSASHVAGRVRGSKAGGLARAVAMMNEHAAELGEFLTQDEKGKLLPGYLAKLSEALSAEQAEIMDELGRLTNSIDHIKEVVATQQSYAGASQLVEPVRIRDLVDDALRMNAGSLARHDVTVVREIADLPELPLDRHRVLQILVNLISNAKQAMDATSERPHRMTVRAALVDDGTEGPRLRIRVEDEGEGIAPENLTRIFSHGFTTRKNGHGFGLHSCALAAREMGGTLSAHSDGPGRGAVFTLDLPMPADAPVSSCSPEPLPERAAA